MRGVDISKKLERLKALPGRELPAACYEYLMVLSPPEALWQRIMEVKGYFGNKYKAPLALKTKPHITLVHFFSPAISQATLVSKLGRVTDALSPFMITLDNFGSFPCHTIFTQVTTRQPIRDIVNGIKAARDYMKIPEQAPHFIDEPHLTIARKLLPWQYEQGWLEFSNLDFKGRFMADELLLLHRPSDGVPHAYQVTQQFPLRGQALVRPVQCSLFD